MSNRDTPIPIALVLDVQSFIVHFADRSCVSPVVRGLDLDTGIAVVLSVAPAPFFVGRCRRHWYTRCYRCLRCGTAYGHAQARVFVDIDIVGVLRRVAGRRRLMAESFISVADIYIPNRKVCKHH